MRARRIPRRLSLVVGVAAIAVGATLTLKPFRSLDALTVFIAASLILAGLGEFASSRDDADLWRNRLLGVVLAATGLVALLLPDVTVRTVGVAVGIGLVVGGLTRLAAVFRRGATDRYVSIVGGLASVVLGLLALSWRDATILVVALLVGPAAVIFGIGQVLRAMAGRPAPRSGSTDRAPARGWSWGNALLVLRVTVSLLVALGLIGVSAFLHRGSPSVDAFYQAPDDVPSTPGQLIRAEAFGRGIPTGSRAERILFSTTVFDGSIGVASALVVVPTTPQTGPWPVVLWAHGTTGVAQPCAPTLLPDPLGAGAMPAQQQAIDLGWALVAPDYIGLGTTGAHPYLSGAPTAHSALDAVRAARQLTDLRLGEATVVWGHSQGGGVALWIGTEVDAYAPDVPLAGIAALAPASDLPALAATLTQGPIGMLFGAFVVEAYSRVYPEIAFDDYVRASARAVVRQVVTRCLSEPATLLSLGAVLTGEQIFARDPTSGALGARLAENVPTAAGGIPTFLGQGADDTLIRAEVQAQFVDGVCAAGQSIDYRIYAGRDHRSVVATDSPLVLELLAWTQARFTGQPQSPGCTTTEH